MEDSDITSLESPELLLSGLNAALCELRGAVDLLDDDSLAKAMAPVLRKLLLAEVVGQEWIVAIGGSQGAGKTTLLRTIYELQGADARWLPPNEGQGEKMPVLVLEEAGRSRVAGAVRCLEKDDDGTYRVQDVDLSVEDFLRALRDPDPTHLLPVLKVPRKYFHRSNQAWLLLPGYEKLEGHNKDWQQLMRQALIGAAGCVIVTDETRMASQLQCEIVRDMLANELPGAQPVVVITKTESSRGDADRQQRLRRVARETFRLPAECADARIVCAGADDNGYVSEWLPAFKALAEDLALSGGSSRVAQLKRLEQVLGAELSALLERIQAKVRQFMHRTHAGDGGEQESVDRYFQIFDVECASLREDYQRNVAQQLEGILSNARKEVLRRLRDNHESVWNHAKDLFRTASESLIRIETDISESWQSGGSVLKAHAIAIAPITAQKLTASEPMPKFCEAGARPVGTSLAHHGDPVENVDAPPLPSLRPNGEDLHNLRVLMAAPGSSVSERNLQSGVERSIELLPALVLEYARIASVVPAAVGVDARLNAHKDLERPDLVQLVRSQLGEGVSIGQNVLRGIAAVLAIDVVIDGEVDIVRILGSAVTGAGTAGTAGTAAAAGALGSTVVGVVAVGFLALQAMRQVRANDAKAIEVATALLHGIREHHLRHFLMHYDQIMKLCRERLKQSLRARFKLDTRLMHEDRLVKALADVRFLKRELQHHLSRTGVSVSLFNPAAFEA